MSVSPSIDSKMANDLFLPRFSQAEYQRRYELTRNWMADAGLDVLVIYASAYGSDNVRWLTNFAPRHDTYLIWPLAGKPVLFTQLFNHVPNARRVSVVPDVRWGGPNSGISVAETLQERGIVHARVGLVGRVPYQDYLTLLTCLPDVSWVRADKGYRVLRLVKSQEELEWLRRGAAHTDAAMAALVEAAVPGASEYELVAAIEAAYTRAGGEHGIHFLSTTPMEAPQSYVPAQAQTARRLQRGDVIISELSAGVGGYAGQIHRPLAVGREPTPLYQHLYTVALETYQRIVDVLCPGATVGDVLDAADYVEAQGLSVCDDLLHGYGMGYLPPVLRTRATAHSQQPPDDFIFEENMAIVVQPNVYDPESGAGLQVGNLLVITGNGAESLQAYPMEFKVCRNREGQR
jgi:Xaa-Pro aminopeptidase